MRKTIIAVVISSVVAFAAASWIYTVDRGPEEAAGSTEAGSSFDAGLPAEDRIAALERAVSDERFARQLLQEEVFYLTDALRQELGDADYERHLAANNRSTSIRVSNVIDSSPAPTANTASFYREPSNANSRWSASPRK